MTVTAVPIRPIKKGSVTMLWIGLAVLALVAAAIGWWSAAGERYQTTASGLQYRVLKPGEGPHPTEADIALIDYTGRFRDGRIFDTSVGKRPVPIAVAGGSIPGFEEGLKLMRKGATYRLRIPSRLAYGAMGQPPVIPANADLEFDVTLINFLPQSVLQSMGGAGGAPPAGM